MTPPWVQEEWQRMQSALHQPGGQCFLFEQVSTHLIPKCIQTILCPEKCGVCAHCQDAHSTHGLNHRVIAPTSVQANVSIDEIRALESWVHGYPTEGRLKLLVVSEAAAMRTAAVNGCLKLFESLPEYAVVLLFTQYPSRLLPTLRSRCLVHRAANVAMAAQLQWLKQTSSASSALDSSVALAMRGGQWQRALHWLREDLDAVQTIQALVMQSARTNSVQDAKKLPKGMALPCISTMLYTLRTLMMTAVPSHGHATLVDELLSLHGTLQQGVSLRESSLISHALQRWYSHVTPQALKELQC